MWREFFLPFPSLDEAGRTKRRGGVCHDWQTATSLTAALADWRLPRANTPTGQTPIHKGRGTHSLLHAQECSPQVSPCAQSKNCRVSLRLIRRPKRGHVPRRRAPQLTRTPKPCTSRPARSESSDSQRSESASHAKKVPRQSAQSRLY